MNAPATQPNTILFPPGRIVQGDLYNGQDKDQAGNPLTVKTGANAGKATVRYFFAVAIPKTQQNWWHEVWGQKIFAIAAAAWPQGQTANPNFAWKIEDGDSQIPNQNGRKNADREGHARCWIIKFSSSFPAKVFDAQSNPLVQPGLVKPGFWVEVLGTVEGNGQPQKPGVYMNHNMVAFRAPDKEIVSGPDPRSVGFGQAALPAGVSAAPMPSMAPGAPMPGAAAPGAMYPPAAAPGAYPPSAAAPAPAAAYPTPGAAPAAYPTPGAMPGPVATPAAVPGAYPAPGAMPVSVAPNPSFIAPPGAAPAPMAAPAAPMAPAPAPAVAADPLGAPAGFRMANPQGANYTAHLQQGWNNETLLAAGHMVRL